MKSKKNESRDVRKFVLTDVESCAFTFTDGLTSKVKPIPGKEIVLVKLIPHSTKPSAFEDRILKNYASANNIQELANACGYDCLKTFTRHFKKCFAQTPYQWMLDRKMEEINSLVINSNMTITEIARMYDFKSASHMVSLYNKYYGISPQKNREKHNSMK